MHPIIFVDIAIHKERTPVTFSSSRKICLLYLKEWEESVKKWRGEFFKNDGNISADINI